ncbi:MAG: methyl-accepting chemotaxis protein, partial [Burkholderiaceae bacterium]
VEEATAATHSLKNEAKALAEMVARFRVAEGAMATSQAAPRVNYRPPAEAPAPRPAVSARPARASSSAAAVAVRDDWEEF